MKKIFFAALVVLAGCTTPTTPHVPTAPVAPPVPTALPPLPAPMLRSARSAPSKSATLAAPLPPGTKTVHIQTPSRTNTLPLLYTGAPVSLVSEGNNAVVVWATTLSSWVIQYSVTLTNWVTLAKGTAKDTNQAHVLVDVNAGLASNKKFYRMVPRSAVP